MKQDKNSTVIGKNSLLADTHVAVGIRKTRLYADTLSDFFPLLLPYSISHHQTLAFPLIIRCI